MSPTDASTGKILSHAVLIGLTPLIPVPLLDDAIKNFFARRLVRALAEARGAALSESDVAALTEERGGGCLRGCLTTAIIYPIKRLLAKVFYFLEVKRAVDLTSAAYHRGLLVDHAIAIGALGYAGSYPAAHVAAAIDDVIRAAPTKPVEQAVRLTFAGGTGALRSAASMLRNAVRRVPKGEGNAELRSAVEALEAPDSPAVTGLAADLRGRVEAIPAEYYERLYASLRARLTAPVPPVGPKA